MSTYTVNEICYRLVHDPPFRVAAQGDFTAAIANEDLTPDERRALVAGDVGALFRLGAHAFLLGHLARYAVAGLNVPIYNERMRAVASDG